MKIDDYIALLKSVVKFRRQLSGEVVFNMEIKLDRYLMLYSIRVWELAESIICLYQNDLLPPIPIIFRSLLEAFVDYENLHKDHDYINYLDYEFYIGWDKKFKSAERGNPYLKGLVDPQIKASILNKEFDSLKGKKIKKLTHEEKIKKVSDSAIYYSVYDIACGESHNDLNVLLEWNVNVNQNKSFDIIAFSQKKENLIPFLDSTSAILINMIKSLSNYFRITTDVSVSNFISSLEAIRKY